MHVQLRMYYRCVPVRSSLISVGDLWMRSCAVLSDLNWRLIMAWQASTLNFVFYIGVILVPPVSTQFDAVRRNTQSSRKQSREQSAVVNWSGVQVFQIVVLLWQVS